MQKITPCLWFSGQVNEALNLYTSVFKNAKVKDISHYPENSPILPGDILVATFEIENQEFMILNGSPNFPQTEAISFVINCKSQEEVDYYWDALTTNGGQEGQCGWLKDRFGVSWQVVPTIINELMTKDPAKGSKVVIALMDMVKIDIKKLEEAFNS
jgi:predicted 3-demethylubiquinone-9 3-methyltransferase (glyoxalase superfamily)